MEKEGAIMRYMKYFALCGLLVAAWAGEASAAAAKATATVAVFPFDNVSQERGLDWIGSGVAETLVTGLKKVKEIKVIERSQLAKVAKEMKLKLISSDEKDCSEAAKLTGADKVVVGGFQSAGDKLRLTARVVNVSNGEVIDTADVKGERAKLFDMQDELVEKVIAMFNLKLTPEEKVELRKEDTGSMKAFEHYVKGKDGYMSFDASRYPDAIKEFEAAVAVDENYAIALAGLAQVCLQLGFQKEQRGEDAHRALAHGYLQSKKFKEAADEAQKAIDLNRNDAEAWEILGRANPKGDPKWVEDKLLTAIEIDPNFMPAYMGIAEIYFGQGKTEKAREKLVAAVGILPKSVEANNMLGIVCKKAGDAACAEKHFNVALESEPNSAPILLNLGNLYLETGKHKEAVTALKRVLELDPKNPQVDKIREIIKTLEE
jgi:tetratricopeptide (TPR) repeat protein